MNNPQLPLQDWNAFYQSVPADDIPWEIGGPSTELIHAVEDGFIVPPARVLDIGCGLGSQSIYLAKNGFEVIGVDIAPSAIDKAQKLARFSEAKVQFAVGDATSMAYTTDSFDIVYDRACFHHLKPQEQERYKWEVMRVLTEGGVYIVTMFAVAASGAVIEQFFMPLFDLVDEETFTVAEKASGNMVTLRTLFFEKRSSLFFEAN